MKTNREMAHEYALKHMEISKGNITILSLVEFAWQYADKMQAEEDKREKADAEIKRAEMRKLLNADNTFVEKEGMHFDDVNFEPDWSKAPSWANWWVATADPDGKISGGWFYDVEPGFGESKGVSIYYSSSNDCVLTESFGYQGDWKESLRKRPV